MNMRIGIFAGSFDPIHDGHLAVARSAVTKLDLDSLYFLVEEQPWGHKKPIEVKFRRSMIEIAINNESKINQLELNDKQFNIVNTLQQLESKFPECELYFIFGGDVFMQMNSSQWPHLNKLLKHNIVVFERKSISEKEITEHAKRLSIEVVVIPSLHENHSSTDVRKKPHKKHIWVPLKVAEYIEENNLYKVSDSSSE